MEIKSDNDSRADMDDDCEVDWAKNEKGNHGKLFYDNPMTLKSSTKCKKEWI